MMKLVVAIAATLGVAALVLVVLRPLTRRFIYPVDPSLGLSRDEQRSIRSRAALHSAMPIWIQSVVIVAIMFVVFAFRQWVFDFFDARGLDALGNGLFWVTLLLVPMIVMGALGRRACARGAYTALREAGHEVCHRCGYPLRGLATDVRKCPECGTWRRPL